MDQAGVGIDVERLKEQRKQGGKVGVHQFEQPQANKEQERSLEELEDRDGKHPGLMPARTFPHETYLYHTRFERFDAVAHKRDRRLFPGRRRPECSLSLFLSVK